jgi:uncharacterized membrane protein SirB2
LGNFSLERQKLCFIYPSLSQIYLSNQALCVIQANRFLPSPLMQDVPHSSDLVLFLNGMVIFCIVVAVPHSPVPFTLKAAELNVCLAGQLPLL